MEKKVFKVLNSLLISCILLFVIVHGKQAREYYERENAAREQPIKVIVVHDTISPKILKEIQEFKVGVIDLSTNYRKRY